MGTNIKNKQTTNKTDCGEYPGSLSSLNLYLCRLTWFFPRYHREIHWLLSDQFILLMSISRNGSILHLMFINLVLPHCSINSFSLLVYCLVIRLCSWSPRARSESGIWSLSPPSATNKRVCCWVWISPTQRGMCGLPVAVQYHKESHR